jgi:site-specific recombinase XerD
MDNRNDDRTRDEQAAGRSLLPVAAVPALPDALAHLSGLLADAEVLRAQAQAPNTVAAYVRDWEAWLAFCRHAGVMPDNLSALTVSLYLTYLARHGSPFTGRPLTPGTIERRLYGLVDQARSHGQFLDARHPDIQQVLAGIRATRHQPPRPKQALQPDEVKAMVATLPLTLRGLRDRALLLLGYASALRRAELVGLEAERPTDPHTPDCRGWIEWHAGGLLLLVRGKGNRWRMVPVGPGSSDGTCPLHHLRRWLEEARIVAGPVFRGVAPDHKVGPDRLNDRQVARLVQRTALAAGIRADLPEAERAGLFAAHSLRSGHATYAVDIEEHQIQRQLGHRSVATTRRYRQTRDLFGVNLTQAVGL